MSNNTIRKRIDLPDIGNPENLTREERVSRALHHKISRRKLKFLPEDHFFEHFIVVGVPPKETLKYKLESRSIPQLLYHYPPDKPLEGLRVAQFLFPDGVRARSFPQTASHSQLFEALYAKPHLKHPEDYHAFLLNTEEKEILYGVCITRQEPVNTSRKKYDVDVELGAINELLDCDTIVLAQQSYCFISKYPFFKLNFNVLKQILAIQHMQITQFQLAAHLSQSSDSMTAPPVISEVLEKYYGIGVPKPGETIEKQLAWTSERTVFARDTSGDEEAAEFQQFGAGILFALLPKEVIVRVLAAIMVEKRIVFVSSNMRILSAVMLAFVPLLRPFVYQSVFLPVIPQSLQVVYTAPVPFVIGATSMPKESELYDELLILDIEKKSFILPPKCVLPSLPGWKDLCLQVDAPLKQLAKSFASNHYNGIPYDPLPEESQQLECVTTLFQHHLSNLFQNFRSHCITDVSDSTKPVSVFIKENFVLLEYADKEDQEFMRMFLDTQLFFDFSDKQLRNKDEKRAYICK